MAIADSKKAIHVAKIAVEMHGKNGLGPRGDRSFDVSGVCAPGVRLDIHKDGLGAQMDDRRRAGDPIGVRHDHFVARSDAQRRHADVQRARTTGRGDGVLGADMLPESLLEPAKVLVASLSPAMAGGVRGVLDLKVRDRGFGVVDASAHRISRVGTAVTNFPPQLRMYSFWLITSSTMFHGNTTT
ncbi:hypothetical protein D3C72_1692120 [compost metagenome]